MFDGILRRGFDPNALKDELPAILDSYVAKIQKEERLGEHDKSMDRILDSKQMQFHEASEIARSSMQN